MDCKRIINFLRQVGENNNREWFQQHKDEYTACKKDFEDDVTYAISRIAEFDSSIAHVIAKDAVYRFYRDTRFSPDKSPYKRHFGAYISAHGKKALHGGYYLHIEPDNCLLACGNYWLPTNILTSCRNEIMANIDEWRSCVENKKFLELFGKPGCGVFEKTPNGFGLGHLKMCPSGFPRDYKYIEYLRMKDFCCWKNVDDTFFQGNQWLDEIVEVFKIAKPMMDFINNVIDDYE